MSVAVMILVPTGTCCRNGKNDTAGIVVVEVMRTGEKEGRVNLNLPCCQQLHASKALSTVYKRRK